MLFIRILFFITSALAIIYAIKIIIIIKIIICASPTHSTGTIPMLVAHTPHSDLHTIQDTEDISDETTSTPPQHRRYDDKDILTLVWRQGRLPLKSSHQSSDRETNNIGGNRNSNHRRIRTLPHPMFVIMVTFNQT